MTDFVAALHERVLVCDGAMGTMLHAAGNSLDRALPELNLSNPDLVSTVHDSYVDAGVDLILTNTFGASRLRLAENGYGDVAAEINRVGVLLAREAANAAPKAVFVGGSIAPAVSAPLRQRIPAGERAEALREQAAALAEAGVDVLVLETFGYLDELLEAVRVTAEVTDLPILAQATFTTDGHTPGGETPREVATALTALPIAALGANCTVGPQRMLGIVEELRRATTLPISAQPNAGLPRRTQGRRFEYSLDHDYFARYARRCVEAGASIVGGCCGTTPTHIRAVSAAVEQFADPTPASPVSRAAPDEFANQLAARGFVVAAEIAPPIGGTADVAAKIATTLHGHGVDLVLVSAVQGPRAQLSSTSLALHLQQQVGVETIATVTTWDKTIMSLQADLLGAHAFGTRTVVCETGNPPLRGDYPNADGIWEVDSIGLIELLAALNAGRDCNGLSLATKTSFHIGARCNPGAEDLDAEISQTRAKIAAGAQFLITRPVYELDGLSRLLTALGQHRVPVLLTVSPLSGFAEAEFLAYEVPDVTIPPAILKELATAGTAAHEVGATIATDLLAQARSLADGVVIVVHGHHETTQALFAAASQ
ncbi:MAG TPA: bifunctional homocysteine S-methyltransferase/methylenetetrahydrofolate reductase [Mycobacterium sp.]|nr:bifunctional homocysteine S-methyltransferase/methylenetetrahydrofolate reductase [Mycobacterium sp.]